MITKNEMKRRGEKFELTACINENGEVTSVSLNGYVSETVWYSEKYKVSFAAFNIEGKNYWVSVYKNKPHLSFGGNTMRKEDFLRDYAPAAFSPIVAMLFSLFGLFLPNLVLCIFCITQHTTASIGPYLLMFACGMMWFTIINNIPTGNRIVRRKICLLSILSVLGSVAFYWFTNCFSI